MCAQAPFWEVLAIRGRQRDSAKTVPAAPTSEGILVGPQLCVPSAASVLGPARGELGGPVPLRTRCPFAVALRGVCMGARSASQARCFGGLSLRCRSGKLEMLHVGLCFWAD